MFSITPGPSIQAMIRMAPLQAGQISISIPNTRFRRFAQVMAPRRWTSNPCTVLRIFLSAIR